jgi:hypothetical protein
MNRNRNKSIWQRWSARLAVAIVAVSLLVYKFLQVYAVLGRRHH